MGLAPWANAGPTRQYNEPRMLVRAVSCPNCHAKPGERCIGHRGKLRTSNHAERVMVFRSSEAARKRREAQA